MNSPKNKINFAVVCFYFASGGGNGAAEVTLGIFNSIKERKKLFEINDKNIDIKLLNFLFKISNIIKIIPKISKFFKRDGQNVIIIEGASWIGLSFIFFVLSKFLIRNSIVIYHSHNIEYDIRIKNNSNFFIIFLTKFFENFIFRKCNFGTVVSKEDKKRIKKLYNINTYLLENGVSLDRIILKKPSFKLPSKYFMFIGSYWFKPNKESIDLILNELLPKIRLNDKNIIFILTGNGLPIEKIKNEKNILYLKNLNKFNLNYLIYNSDYLLFPMKEATGTKLKIIESLMIGGNIITSKAGMKGIDKKFINVPYLYKNKKHLLNILTKNKTYLKKNNIKKLKISKYYKERYDMSKILYKFLNLTTIYD